MKNIQIAYLAGIIDGEGTVNITYVAKRDSYRLRIQVVNTDKRLIDWLHENFHSHIYEVKRHSLQNPKWRKRYEWFLFPKRDTLPLLKSLIPFLICKKEQMKIAVSFIETTGKMGKRLSRDVYKARKEYKERLNALNMRGASEQRLSEKTAKADAIV